jgi:transposase-like protein
MSGHSNSKLRRVIQYWLNNPPEPRKDFSLMKNILFDGTYIQGRKSIIGLMDGFNNEIYAGQYGIAENSIPQLRTFFIPLFKKGLNPKSATVDGNSQVIKLFKELWPDIVIQRCLVHIQRQGLMWCRRFPKRTDAKHLRKIFKKITYIRSEPEKNKFLLDLEYWENRFGQQIQSNAERGKVFSDIKRARSMLLKALPNMFHYLNDPQIPFSTNGIESYFSRLKPDYRRHRGLSIKSRQNYFKWYFSLKSR